MTPFLLAKKIGMTQVFGEDGAVIPVTVLEAGPCVVTQVKTIATDGYQAIQLGFGTANHISKPRIGHFAKSKATSRYVCEARVADSSVYAVGQTVDVGAFENLATVNISGVSKGKGFAGVIKRHNFSRGPETHGSAHHRKPGSIGAMFPQRVLKGQKLPGHLGATRTTVPKLQIVQIDAAHHVMLIRGAVPGANGSIVEVAGVVS